MVTCVLCNSDFASFPAILATISRRMEGLAQPFAHFSHRSDFSLSLRLSHSSQSQTLSHLTHSVTHSLTLSFSLSINQSINQWIATASQIIYWNKHKSDTMAEEQDIKTAAAEESEISSNWDELTPTFDAMNLKEDLLKGIYAYGFERPSAIQQRAIMPSLLGRDVIAQAQSGKQIVIYCSLLRIDDSPTPQVPARPPLSPFLFCSVWMLP
jgi:hypothetical protein